MPSKAVRIRLARDRQRRINSIRFWADSIGEASHEFGTIVSANLHFLCTYLESVMAKPQCDLDARF